MLVHSTKQVPVHSNLALEHSSHCVGTSAAFDAEGRVEVCSMVQVHSSLAPEHSRSELEHSTKQVLVHNRPARVHSRRALVHSKSEPEHSKVPVRGNTVHSMISF